MRGNRGEIVARSEIVKIRELVIAGLVGYRRVLRYSALFQKRGCNSLVFLFSRVSKLELSNLFLDQPNQFLPILVDAIQDELAFYSIDMDGRFVFLSNSAESVLNHSLQQWQNRTFIDTLTDNPCNDPIRTCEWNSMEGNSSTGRICEIYDRDGNRLKLKHWRVHIVRDGVPIGFSGIIRRLQDKANTSQELDSVTEKELMDRVNTLTPVEFQVIDMVVDGNMNKKMAAILGVAVRTIESRRARAMSKLQTKTLSELVQAWVNVRQIKARQR